MADFSQYDGPSEEWLRVTATTPVPEIPVHLPPSEVKRILNDARQAAQADAMLQLAPQVVIKDHAVPTRDGSSIQARSYRPVSAGEEPLPVFYYLHGGGHLIGNIENEDANCARNAINANVAVLHVNYRHTPEHVYPTQWNDAEDGFLWLHSHIAELGGIPERVVVGGISAGGQLAAWLTLQKNLGNLGPELPPLTGLVLMVPNLININVRPAVPSQVRDPTLSSYETNKDAPVLPVKMIQYFTDLLKLENPDPRDLRLSPGNATMEQVRGFPPTTVGVSGMDPLRDEGLLFAKMLTEVG